MTLNSQFKMIRKNIIFMIAVMFFAILRLHSLECVHGTIIEGTHGKYIKGETYIAGEIDIWFHEHITEEEITQFITKYSYSELKQKYRTSNILKNLRKFMFNDELVCDICLWGSIIEENIVRSSWLATIWEELYIPNDPGFSNQWSLRNTGQYINVSETIYPLFINGTAGADIKATEAWSFINSTQGNNREKVVAVIDSGFIRHWPDLEQRWRINHNETEDPYTDADGNGARGDYWGWNATTNSGNIPTGPTLSSHGTIVSSIAAAIGDNGTGISGVCLNYSDIKIFPICASADSINGGGFNNYGILRALEYVRNRKTEYNNDPTTGVNFVVVNMSFIAYNAWNTQYKTDLENLINEIGQIGVLSVAAAGNNDYNNDLYLPIPAAINSSYLITVGGTNHNDERWSSSNYGQYTVNISAPAMYICFPKYDVQIIGGNFVYTPAGFTYLSGTSLSTAFVTGAIPLMYKAASVYLLDNFELDFPISLTHAMKAWVLSSGDSLSTLGDYTLTGRRLNGLNAVTLVRNVSIPLETVEIRTNLVLYDYDGPLNKHYKILQSATLTINNSNYYPHLNPNISPLCGFEIVSGTLNLLNTTLDLGDGFIIASNQTSNINILNGIPIQTINLKKGNINISNNASMLIERCNITMADSSSFKVNNSTLNLNNTRLSFKNSSFEAVENAFVNVYNGAKLTTTENSFAMIGIDSDLILDNGSLEEKEIIFQHSSHILEKIQIIF